MTVNDAYGDLHHWTDIAPSWEVAEAFTQQSRTWVDGASALDAFLDQGIQNLDLATLLSALVENRWLGTSSDHLPPSTTIGLGNVGYTTEDCCSITIANLHSLLSSVDGSTLTWDVESCQSPTPEDTVVMECLGQSYKRHRHQSCQKRLCRRISNTFEVINGVVKLKHEVLTDRNKLDTKY